MANDAEKRQQLNELESQMERVKSLTKKLKADSVNPNLVRVQKLVLARKAKLRQEAKVRLAARKLLKSLKVKRRV